MNRLLIFAALICLLTFSEAARADSLRLVNDIRTDISSEINSNPPAHIMIGQQLFFTSLDREHGLELWVSDGTSAGTYLLQDIFPGAASSEPGQFVAANGILYFTALHPSYGRELWRSDGTAGGTRLVRDVRPGVEPSVVQFVTPLGGEVYFAADDGQSGSELWKTDGTSAGTQRVRDINPGAASSSPHDLAVLDNKLYFGASDGNNGDELWRSDGTESGTAMLKDLRPGGSSTPTLLTAGSGVIYFSAKGADGKDYLWTTDGSAAGTSSSLQVSCERILVANGKLFFTKIKESSSATAASGPVLNLPMPLPVYRELWTSDGTQAGTTRVFPGRANSPFIDFLVNGSKLYFSTAAAPQGFPYFGCSSGLFRVDTGTYRLEEIPAISTDIRDMVAFGGKPYFLNNAGLQAVDSNTTPTLVSPPGAAIPAFLDGNSTRMIFGRFPGQTGSGQLWRSDGTSPGTAKIAALGYRTRSSVKAPFAETNGTVKFRALDAEHGQEIWRSDLTEAGTRLLVDLVPGPASCYARQLVSWKGALFFDASDSSYTQKLWRSDGSAAGTQPILTIPAEYYIENLFGGSKSFLWFVLRKHTSSGDTFSVWKSDGTAIGTAPIKAFAGAVELVTEQGGLLYFNVLVDGYYRLWRTDGTVAGTMKLLDFGMEQFVVQNETLYFIAMNQTQQYRYQLWKTNGIVSGTSMISDDSPTELTAMGGDVYFNSYSNGIPGLSKLNVTKMQISLVDEGTTITERFNGLLSHGDTLYYRNEKFFRGGRIRATDGSPSGCVTLMPFTGEFAYTRLTTDGKLFIAAFGAMDVYADDELWVSDGTPAGTVLLKTGLNIYDGNIFEQAVGTRYFFINRARAGHQLWVSDGTADGTKMLMLTKQDETELSDFPPEFFLKGDGRIVIAANDGVWGKELWAYVPNEIEVLSPAAGNVVANGGTMTVHWRTDTPTAGSFVCLELWKGEKRIGTLRDSYRASGDGVEFIPVPPVQPGSDYRILAISDSNAPLQAWSSYFTITGQPRNAARPGVWNKYR